MSTSQGAPEAGAYWKHLKSGHLVRVLGIGKMQSGKWIDPIPPHGLGHPRVDMADVVIYEHDGNLWARPRDEFEDGRFALATSPSPPPGVGEPTDAMVGAVAQAIVVDLFRQDYQPGAPVLGDDLTLPWLDQGEVNFGEVARAALKAAMLAPPVGVDVVKLEWREEEHEPNWWTAWHAGARLGYEVRATHRGKVLRRIIGENWTDFDGDIDEAKSAAQADFERRIRSVIVPSPLLKEAEEALRKIADIARRNFGRQDEKMADIEPIARAVLARLGAAP